MTAYSTQLASAIGGFLILPVALWITGNAILIIAPAMFWFMTLPFIALVIFAGSTVSTPGLKRTLTNAAIAMGAFLLASTCLLMTLAMR